LITGSDLLPVATCTVRCSCIAYQRWTWIGSIHGFDWIGRDDCFPAFFN